MTKTEELATLVIEVKGMIGVSTRDELLELERELIRCRRLAVSLGEFDLIDATTTDMLMMVRRELRSLHLRSRGK